MNKRRMRWMRHEACMEWVCDKEPLASLKSGEFFDQLSDY